MRGALAACFLLLAACAQAPVDSTVKSVPLIGTWRLVSVVAVRKNGEQVPRFGTAPKGYILYDGTGHMAVQIMSSPWPAFQNPEKPTPQELQRVFDGYVAYAGSYDYDAEKSSVTHHVQMSVDPADVGQDFRRTVELAGDRVTLTVQHYPLNGEEVQVKLTWERVRS